MGQRKHLASFLVLACAAAPCAWGQFTQQGLKLVGTGAINTNTGVNQGSSVALSGDGNTMIVGGWADNGLTGAAWVYTRSNGTWTQQGPKLIGSGAVVGTIKGNTQGAQQGSAVALSADGNTAIVSGYTDNSGLGAAWIFTRTNGSWSQQGSKLTGNDAVTSSAGAVFQGISVALSADGNTALVGGYGDNNPIGAAWVYTRTNGNWSQQGSKLVGTTSGAQSNAYQGFSVGLSADGNTAVLGGPADGSYNGAAWIFTRSSNGAWSQQGNKLVGTGATGSGVGQGWAVAISGDGRTVLLGGPGDNTFIGAAWVFTLTNGTWTQQGNKLVGTGLTTALQYQGVSVALSGSGNLALVGGAATSTASPLFGAAWIFKRSGSTWSQPGGVLEPSDFNGTPNFGYSTALSSDGATAAIGGPNDNTTGPGPLGAAWVFVQPAATHFVLTAPSAAAPGSPFSVTVVALDANNNSVTGYGGTVHFSSNDPAPVLPAKASLTNGIGTFSVTLNSAGTRTITATDVGNPSVTGTTSAIAVMGTEPTGAFPGGGNIVPEIMTFTFSDPRGYQDLDVVNILINNFLDGRQACYLAYSRSINVLYLVNDAGTALLPGLVLNGQSGSVSNSQCTVNGSSSYATGTGNTLTLNLSLNFLASFGGNKVFYLAARDLQGGNSGWQPLGTWNIPGQTTFPAVLGMTPTRGAGSQQSFVFTFNDTKGFQDLGVVNVLINGFLDGRQGCYLAYSRPAGQLFLENDTGTGLLPGVTLGTSGTLSNSQCSVALASSSAVGNGNSLTLTLNLSFTGAFDGNRVIYAAARDSTDANNSGWQSVGSWTVQ
jgi:hypothetical protein